MVQTQVTRRYAADPQDELQIVAETSQKVVLKVMARNNQQGRTEQFEFELNHCQIKALLTFGGTPR